MEATERRPRLSVELDRLRAPGVVMLAGIMAGVLVGGVGGRVSMRISGALTHPDAVGRPTADGNRVGEITLGGTLELMVVGGVLAGLVGGVLYLALRPWLMPLGAWRGFAFGGYVLAVFGTAIIRSDSFDFAVFGPPLLNVLMYAAMFVLFGIVMAWLVAELDRRIPSSPFDGTGRLRAASSRLLLVFASLLAVVPVAGALTESSERLGGAQPSVPPTLPGVLPYVFLYMVIALPLLQQFFIRAGRTLPVPVIGLLLGWPAIVGLSLWVNVLTTILAT